ncbi:MAG: GAF domain-containing protein, partial [Candidatus Eisenbacteria bacterium]|nr:GAF domain-containing protein [Candidatus Eisenbacteria bacterium]
MHNDPDPARAHDSRPQPRHVRPQPAYVQPTPSQARPEPSPRTQTGRLERGGVSADERSGLLTGVSELRKAETRIDRLTRLLKLSQRLSSILDHEVLLDAILDEAIPLANAQRALILLEAEGGGLEMARGRSAEGEPVPNDLSKVSGTLARSCIAENRVQVYDNLADRLEFQQVRSIRLNFLYSAICLPLRDKGTAFGVLYLDSSTPTVGQAGVELDVLEGFAAHASICLINARLMKRLERSHEILVRENR